MKLSVYLKQPGVTATSVARSLGVSHTTVSRWAAGSIRPGIDKLEQLQRLTNDKVRPGDFYGVQSDADMMDIMMAQASLSTLIDRVAQGTDIIITRSGLPVARLTVPEPPLALTPRVLGGLAGLGRVPDDFDAPLPDDVLDSFEAV